MAENCVNRLGLFHENYEMNVVFFFKISRQMCLHTLILSSFQKTLFSVCKQEHVSSTCGKAPGLLLVLSRYYQFYFNFFRGEEVGERRLDTRLIKAREVSWEEANKNIAIFPSPLPMTPHGPQSISYPIFSQPPKS